MTDAHVAQSSPRLAQAARGAGVPFMVDPQTHYLQDTQHDADRWAQLAFASPAALTPGDLLAKRAGEALVAGVLEHQLACGATALIAPYVHIERADDGWREAQIALWQATGRYLERQGLRLPILPVLALGWRLLERREWPATLTPLIATLETNLAVNEIALAASRVAAGVTAADRLTCMVAVIRELRAHWPVLMWQQGELGDAALAAGAEGYECGIGWRERCDLGSQMRAHRKPTRRGGSARPVYIGALRASLPKSSVEALLAADPAVAARLTCLDPTCCPSGRQALLTDARSHAIAARRRSIELVIKPAQPAWRWNHLAREVTEGLALADRVNLLATSTPGVKRINTTALRATLSLANSRRQTLGRRAA
ncbi:hypothetical protein EV189_0835 [Motilibacter rhizosphaerae]|uniref:Uncharacterized protein n=1 Tax=Motilibacter rhizosphaerae TaxID=598652 RepID=A0A4Q7NXE7_9ACTN|nr:hypothetical protein EV189_0835 [Motilibacter rhizosphaerae]